MKKIVRVLLGLMMATALISALGLTPNPALVSPAAAATKKVSYPKKGQTSVKVFELQQRLVKAKALKSTRVSGHFSAATVKAVKKFQKKNKLSATGKVGKRTWETLVKVTGPKPKLTVKGLDKRCKVRGRALCIDKTKRKLYYVKNSKVIKIMDTRLGCRSTPTRMGKFRLFRKSRYHTSSVFHVYMPYAMFYSGGQAVHWSGAFTRHGYRGCSHGCVNIRDKAGIRWVFDRMRVGDRIVIYRS